MLDGNKLVAHFLGEGNGFLNRSIGIGGKKWFPAGYFGKSCNETIQFFGKIIEVDTGLLEQKSRHIFGLGQESFHEMCRLNRLLVVSGSNLDSLLHRLLCLDRKIVEVHIAVFNVLKEDIP